MRAGDPGELNREAADAARRGVDEHCVARLSGAEAIDGVVGRRPLQEDRGDRCGRQVIRDRIGAVLERDDAVGISAPALEPARDARPERKLRALALRRDRADHLGAGRDRRQLLLAHVLATTDHGVAEVDAGHLDVDQELAGAGGNRLVLRESQHLGTSEGVEHIGPGRAGEGAHRSDG